MFRLLLTLFLTILAVPAAPDRIKQLISSQNWLFRLLLAILSYQTPHQIHYSGCSWLSCLSCWQWWHTSFSTAVTETSGNLSFQRDSLYVFCKIHKCCMWVMIFWLPVHPTSDSFFCGILLTGFIWIPKIHDLIESDCSHFYCQNLSSWNEGQFSRDYVSMGSDFP